MAADITKLKNSTLVKIPTCNCWDEWFRCFREAPPSLNTLRRAFTALLRWAYSDVSRFDGYEDALGCLTYSDDEKDSNISINPGSTVDPGNTENIPGILVKVDGGVNFAEVAFSPIASESEDTSNWQQSLHATANINILSRNYDADICCVMGDINMLFLFSLYQRLFETWNWLRGYTIKTQTEPKLTQVDEEDPTKWYESSVVIELKYEYNTFAARESKRLKDYTLNPTPIDQNAS